MSAQDVATAHLEEELTIEEQARIAAEVAAAPTPEKTASIKLDDIADATISRELERLHLEEGRFEFQQRRAKLFASSGLFTIKGVTGNMAIAQAMVKIELGESMGFTPAESLQGIHVINGVTSIASALRAARMQAAGYDWRIDWLGTREHCTGCRLWLYCQGKPVMKPKRKENGDVFLDGDKKPVMEQVYEEFTEADAKKMLTTVWEDNKKRRVSILEKENWKMSPRNMYFARAVTNLQRFHAPRVLNVNIASTEELLDKGEPEQEHQPIMRASISLDQIKPSADPNRGHDATAPTVSAKPELKHLGAKNGVPVYSMFPPKETVTDGQKLYVRQGNAETLYVFAEDEPDENGEPGTFMLSLG